MERFAVSPPELEGAAGTLGRVEGSLGCPSRAGGELGSAELESAVGAAFEVAETLDAAAAGFERTAGTVERALAMVPSWHGLAAIAYQERCGTYEQAANLAAQSLEHAGAEMRRYGHLYDEAHARIERLQRAAEECLERIKVAEREAAERERAARERAAEAATRSPLDGGYSLAEHADAVRAADAAADDRRRYEAEAEAEREELERLQKEALEEHERIRQAGREAGVATQVAVEGMPRVVAPGAPPAPGGPGAFDPFALSLTAGAKSIDALGGARRSAGRGRDRLRSDLRASAHRAARYPSDTRLGAHAAAAQRSSQAGRTAKTISRFAKPLGPVGPVLDLGANRAQGRSWGESAGRTAMSTGGAVAVGAATGAACGAVTFGLAAAACGAGGAIAGGWLGDKAGDRVFGDG